MIYYQRNRIAGWPKMVSLFMVLCPQGGLGFFQYQSQSSKKERMEAARPLESKASGVTQGLHSFGQSKSQGQCRLRRMGPSLDGVKPPCRGTQDRKLRWPAGK